MIKKQLLVTEFEDGDVMLYDEKEEKTYILNFTSKIVYEYISENTDLSIDDVYKELINKYEDFPYDYFQETIEKFKEFGIIYE